MFAINAGNPVRCHLDYYTIRVFYHNISGSIIRYSILHYHSELHYAN